MIQISFSKVLNDDAIKIVEGLADEIWHEHFTPIIGKDQVEYMLARFQSVRALSEQIDEGFRYYLISDNEGYKGYFGIILKETHLFLSKIYVKASSRNMGYGKQAIKFVEDIAKENKLDKIVLTVNKFNTNSIKAYEKMGFRIIEAIVMDIGNNYFMDDYKMEKTVAL